MIFIADLNHWFKSLDLNHIHPAQHHLCVHCVYLTHPLILFVRRYRQLPASSIGFCLSYQSNMQRSTDGRLCSEALFSTLSSCNKHTRSTGLTTKWVPDLCVQQTHSIYWPRPLGSVCHTSQTCSVVLMADCVLMHCLVHSAAATNTLGLLALEQSESRSVYNKHTRSIGLTTKWVPDLCVQQTHSVYWPYELMMH